MDDLRKQRPYADDWGHRKTNAEIVDAAIANLKRDFAAIRATLSDNRGVRR